MPKPCCANCDPYTCGNCPHREPDTTCTGRAVYGELCPTDGRRADHRDACWGRTLEVERLELSAAELEWKAARLQAQAALLEQARVPARLLRKGPLPEEAGDARERAV